VVLAATLAVGCGDEGLGEQVTVRVANEEVRADVADSPEEQTKGLSGRDELGADEGMLFELPGMSTQTIWMRGMKFPLDIVWIARDRVVDVTARVPAPEPGTADSQLPVYRPRDPVDQILEVNAGWASDHGVRRGDTVAVLR
jgi:uncharacterized membrane protein (UPF0127 family)